MSEVISDFLILVVFCGLFAGCLTVAEWVAKLFQNEEETEERYW